MTRIERWEKARKLSIFEREADEGWALVLSAGPPARCRPLNGLKVADDAVAAGGRSLQRAVVRKSRSSPGTLS